MGISEHRYIAHLPNKGCVIRDQTVHLTDEYALSSEFAPNKRVLQYCYTIFTFMFANIFTFMFADIFTFMFAALVDRLKTCTF